LAKDHTALLEELRIRHQDAQVKAQETQQAFQVAQAAQAKAQADFQKAQQAFAIAQQQFHGWSTAYNTLMAEETARRQAAQQEQLQLPNAEAAPAATTAVQPESIQSSEQTNKTDVIRELLREHPGGLTPTEIWSHVQGQFKYRAYLYSVLKRLRDREELRLSRGKYSVRIIPQEMKGEVTTIQ
jgi:hypothetical protein